MLHGRYGNDSLNQALSILGLVFVGLQILLRLVFGNGVGFQALSLLWLLCIGVMLFRMFSRNFEARRRENEKFTRYWFAFQNNVRNFRNRAPRAKTANSNPTFKERRKYKYFTCTQCAQKLRVPRGKGKLRVTCTRCGNKFDIKS